MALFNTLMDITYKAAAVFLIDSSGIINRVINPNASLLSNAIARSASYSVANDMLFIFMGSSGSSPLLNGDLLTFADNTLYYTGFNMISYQVGTTRMLGDTISQANLSPEISNALMSAATITVADGIKKYMGAMISQNERLRFFVNPLKSLVASSGSLGGLSSQGLPGSSSSTI